MAVSLTCLLSDREGRDWHKREPRRPGGSDHGDELSLWFLPGFFSPGCVDWQHHLAVSQSPDDERSEKSVLKIRHSHCPATAWLLRALMCLILSSF